LKRNLNVSSSFLFLQKVTVWQLQFENVSPETQTVFLHPGTFQLYDKDKSGSISRKEMEDIVSAIYSMVKYVECENEKNELIKIEVDAIFSSFDIVSLSLRLNLTTTFNTKFLRDPTTNLNDPFILRNVFSIHRWKNIFVQGCITTV